VRHFVVLQSRALTIDQAEDPGRPPVLFWDGEARLHNSRLEFGACFEQVEGIIACRGRHDGTTLEGLAGNVLLDRAQLQAGATAAGVPLEQLHARLEIWKDSPEVLRIGQIQAQLFGGRLGGEGRVEWKQGLHYELLVQAAQVQLEQLDRYLASQRPIPARGFKAHNTFPEISGLATASLHLIGNGPELSGIQGSGRIDVPQGKLYRLPLLLDLLKWLGLRMPDRTAFEQVGARFRIKNGVCDIQELDLIGNAISLHGAGRVPLDGRQVQLDFNAEWGRLMHLLPPGLDQISRGISNQLLKIKVRGDLGNVRFEKELVPAVTTPVKQLFGSP